MKQFTVNQKELAKKNKIIKEMDKLNKASEEQEAIFRKYRKMLRDGSGDMPNKVPMFSADSIRLDKTLGSGAYGEVFKGEICEQRFGETYQETVALKQLYIKNAVANRENPKMFRQRSA